jgi:uncharacterized damage-inducible protein DinB
MAGRIDALVTLARYSQHANRRMFEVLGKEDVRERVAEKVDGYFDSIVAILNHLALADIAWIRRLSEVWGSLPVFLRQPASTWAVTEDIFSTPLLTLDALEQQQGELDEFLFSLAREAGPALDAGTVPEIIAYRDTLGNPVSIPAEGALLHVLNHHTHHRGQISQILDAMGIENDYSGIRETL